MHEKWKRLSQLKKKMLKWYIVLWTAYCISFTAEEHVKGIRRMDSPDNICPGIHVILSFLLDKAVKESRPGRRCY